MTIYSGAEIIKLLYRLNITDLGPTYPRQVLGPLTFVRKNRKNARKFIKYLKIAIDLVFAYVH